MVLTDNLLSIKRFDSFSVIASHKTKEVETMKKSLTQLQLEALQLVEDLKAFDKARYLSYKIKLQLYCKNPKKLHEIIEYLKKS